MEPGLNEMLSCVGMDSFTMNLDRGRSSVIRQWHATSYAINSRHNLVLI